MPYDIDLQVDEDIAGSVDEEHLRGVLTALLRSEGAETAALTVVFGGDDLLRGLNREHRERDEPTDVLSFAAEEGEAFPYHEDAATMRYLGDIAVSVPFARRQAEHAGRPLSLELAHLVAHGTYHLLGFDHETEAADGELRQREEALLGPGIHEGSTTHDRD